MSGSPKPSMLTRWLSSRPPSAALEIDARRVTAVAIAGRGTARVAVRLRHRAAARRRRRAGAQRAERSRRGGALPRHPRGTGEAVRPSAADRARAARYGREGLAPPLRQDSAQGTGSRAVDPLADPQGGPLQDRGGADLVAAGRGLAGGRPRIRRHRRAARHHRELRAGVRGSRGACRDRRHDDHEPGERGHCRVVGDRQARGIPFDRLRGGPSDVGATGCSSTWRPTT